MLEPGTTRELDSLMDVATGLFVVATTSGSAYILDLDEHDHGPKAVRRGSRTRAPTGRRRSAFIAVYEATVGRPMHLLLDLALPGVASTSRVDSARSF